MTTPRSHPGPRALRVQGGVFCLLAAGTLAATPWLAAVDPQTLLIGMAVAVFLLGVPHGALDTVFAEKLHGVRTPAGWLFFIAAYLILAALVVLSWHLAPRFFLVAFLLVSAFHFSGDPVIGLPRGTRLLYGSAIIVLPALLHPAEVGMLFAHLIDAGPAAELAAMLHAIAIALLVGEALLVAIAVRTDWLAACEILCVVLLSIFASPLIAFALFFCGMHSPRHVLRTATLAGMAPRSLLLRAAIMPMLACLAAGAGALMLLGDVPVETRLTRLVFIGLAALTVPHMLLVERVRYRGWRLDGARAPIASGANRSIPSSTESNSVPTPAQAAADNHAAHDRGCQN